MEGQKKWREGEREKGRKRGREGNWREGRRKGGREGEGQREKRTIEERHLMCQEDEGGKLRSKQDG